MMQLLSLVAMEPPVNLSADAIRNEKVKVLQAIRPIDLSEGNSCASVDNTAPAISMQSLHRLCPREKCLPDLSRRDLCCP